MNTRILKPKHGPTVLVRPLRNGDIDTVLAVFHRLSDQSRRRRYNGGKARLSEEELWALARVDATHHALVAYVEGDPDPVAIARLVRDGQAAEIAVEVANDYQQRGIGTALDRGAARRRSGRRHHRDNRARHGRQLGRHLAATASARCARRLTPRLRAVDPRRHPAPVTKPSAVAPAAPVGQLARLDRRNMNVRRPQSPPLSSWSSQRPRGRRPVRGSRGCRSARPSPNGEPDPRRV